MNCAAPSLAPRAPGYTIRQAAALLGVSRYMVGQWLDAGKLSVVKLGRRRYVTAQSAGRLAARLAVLRDG